MDAVRSVFSQYVGFSGRARRSEFWYFYLFSLIVNVVSRLLDGLLFDGTQIINGVAAALLILPSLAVGARRLHDTDKSGFRMFWALLPVIGWIMLVIWWAKAGTAGPNRFGADPKGASATTEPVAATV